MLGWHLGDEDGRDWFGCGRRRMERSIPVGRRVHELLLQWSRVPLVERGGRVLLRRGEERLVVERGEASGVSQALTRSVGGPSRRCYLPRPPIDPDGKIERRKSAVPTGGTVVFLKLLLSRLKVALWFLTSADGPTSVVLLGSNHLTTRDRSLFCPSLGSVVLARRNEGRGNLLHDVGEVILVDTVSMREADGVQRLTESILASFQMRELSSLKNRALLKMRWTSSSNCCTD